MTPRRQVATIALLVLVGACTSSNHNAAPVATSTPRTDGPRATAAAQARHFDHAQLAAALPRASELTWLPGGTIGEDDHDLTDRLALVGCSGAASEVPTTRSSATNRVFRSGPNPLATITMYDAATIADAHGYLAGITALLRCPPSAAPTVTASVLPLATRTDCDEVLAVRAEQPVSETVDAWCRVRNLVAWVRLDPSADNVAPTNEQAIATINTTGARLRSLFA